MGTVTVKTDPVREERADLDEVSFEVQRRGVPAPVREVAVTSGTEAGDALEGRYSGYLLIVPDVAFRSPVAVLAVDDAVRSPEVEAFRFIVAVPAGHVALPAAVGPAE